MDRRSFLIGLAALGTLSGCDNPNQTAFRVRWLKNSVPVQFPNEFRKQLTQFQDTRLDFKPEEQLQTLFTNLQSWSQRSGNVQPASGLPFFNQSPEPVPDLITLGDYWLSTAIRQKLIQPFDPRSWQQWNPLPDRWKAIVTRDSDGKLTQSGQVWGAPYRWGGTAIAYRTDIFRDRNLKPPQDWADLWREELRGRVSLLDQPRETIGLVLKKLGQSYNTADLSKVANLESELTLLNRQAKVYSTENNLQSLLVDDVWVAVAWSTDVLWAMRRNPTIAAVFPNSGTALFSDVWVRPAVLPNSVQAIQALTAQWINFCWQPQIAQQLALFSQSASPILTTLDVATLPEALRQNELLTPKRELLDRSDFLEPISDTTIEQYRTLWTKIRQAA